jgi:hypothetical protein
LATLAQDLPFTFLDHALKCGDSLVGLRKADIGSFSHDPLTDLPLMSLLQKNLDEARAYRYTIQSEDSRTDEDDVRKRQALDEVEKTLDKSRLIADVAIMASYEGGSKTELKQRREKYSDKVRQWQLNPQAEEVGIISHRLREEIQVKPFNWEIEFPEVFDRQNGGFDSIVGNPPFGGASENPYQLKVNSSLVSKGVEVGCPSFIFDDLDDNSLSIETKFNAFTFIRSPTLVATPHAISSSRGNIGW